jgi:anti-sigma regulatory factor (Ser/Thr protein kinase)
MVETSVTFPGLPAIVPSARRFVRGILAGTPRAEDMELFTAELAANAIRHTPSGQDKTPQSRVPSVKTSTG